MMRINEQLILEEDYDESYEPTEDGTLFLHTFLCYRMLLNLIGQAHGRF